MSLSKLIADKLKETGLSVGEAAAKAGITAITFKAVHAGKSVPNARSIPKYAKFLGLPIEQVVELAGSRKGKTRKGKKDKKAAKGKRGRPPGKRGRPAGAKPGKRGRPKAAALATGKVKALNAQVARAQKALTKLVAAIVKLGA